MDIDKVLLTKEESEIACEKEKDNCLEYKDCNSCPARPKAQCIKLLKVLEDEGKISNELYRVIGRDKQIHYAPGCWLCKLKNDLGGE